jgi:hypothetical protein
LICRHQHVGLEIPKKIASSRKLAKIVTQLSRDLRVPLSPSNLGLEDIGPWRVLVLTGKLPIDNFHWGLIDILGRHLTGEYSSGGDAPVLKCSSIYSKPLI